MPPAAHAPSSIAVLARLLLAATASLAGEQALAQQPPADAGTVEPQPASDTAAQPDFRISDTIVRRVHRDRRGTLWLGTNGRGVIRYDGSSPEYLSVEQGFGGHAVRQIAEDAAGNVWFGTSGGITRYDGASFTNFTERDGLVSDDVWSLTITRDGTVWVGTLEGACRFDGETFTAFYVPQAEPDPSRGVTSAAIVHCIVEDSRGRLWFANNGGAWIYDGTRLDNLSERDGLCSNAVNDIVEDRNGDMWFATHHAGVCRWDGKSFTHFGAKDGIEGTEAWKFHRDRAGNLWFPIEHDGVYRFDGHAFTRFHTAQGLPCGAVQAIHEDGDGRLWVGGWMALYRYDGRTFVSYTE